MIEPRAIDRNLPLILGVLVVLDQIVGLGALGVPSRAGIPLESRLAAGLLTVVVLSLVLALGRWTWLRTGFARRHPTVSVLSVALAVQIGLTVGRRLSAYGDGTASRPGTGLDEFVFLLAATLVALRVLSALHDHRSRATDLEATEARLRSALSASTTVLAEERARLGAHVRGLLEERLGPTSLRPALFTTEHLRTIADDVLRPLAHQLDTGAGLPATEPVEPSPRTRFSAALRTLRVTPVLRPRLLSVTMVLLAFRFSIAPAPPEIDERSASVRTEVVDGVVLTVDWTSVLEWVALLLATFLIVLVGSRLLRRWLFDRASPVPSPSVRLVRDWSFTAVTLTGLGLTSLALLRTVLTATSFGALPPLTAGSVIGFTAPLLLITVITSLLPAVERALGAMRERLTEINTELAAASARTNALIEHERRLFARLLHASVQPAVNAASLMIERATRDGHVDPSVIADAAAVIDASVERLLDAGRSGPDGPADGDADLDARAAAIAATWEGLATVSILLDPTVREHLAGDPIARATLYDVIAEACANAVIHGRAGRIEATVLPSVGPGDEGAGTVGVPGALSAVELRVVDDGRAPATRKDQGLGGRTLTTSCTHWALDHRDDGTVLTAVLPVR